MSLPKIRELFIPDPGYVICDVDLDRADLQVVVWEADDQILKNRLRAAVDLHISNAIELFDQPPVPDEELIDTHPAYQTHAKRYAKERKFVKAFIHGTNYLGSARTMAQTCRISTAQSRHFQERWFTLHPGISSWHDRIADDLAQTRTIYNKFGYRRVYFDRPDSILSEAVAWIPQSTVGIVTNKAWANLSSAFSSIIQVLLQGHDSLVFQLPSSLLLSLLPAIHKAFLIPIPYPDPLTIPVGIKVSGKSWGEVRAIPWDFDGRVDW